MLYFVILLATVGFVCTVPIIHFWLSRFHTTDVWGQADPHAPTFLHHSPMGWAAGTPALPSFDSALG